MSCYTLLSILFSFFVITVCTACVIHTGGSRLRFMRKKWNKFSIFKGLSVVNAFNLIHRCRSLRLIKSLFIFSNAFNLETGEYLFHAKSLKSLNVFERVYGIHVCLCICMLCGCVSLSLPSLLCPIPSHLFLNLPSYLSQTQRNTTVPLTLVSYDWWNGGANI